LQESGNFPATADRRPGDLSNKGGKKPNLSRQDMLKGSRHLKARDYISHRLDRFLNICRKNHSFEGCSNNKKEKQFGIITQHFIVVKFCMLTNENGFLN
jgi:hypothetical protein